VKIGGEAADSAAAVCRRAARVVISLPHSSVTKSVLDEVAGDLRPGMVIVDTTTGEPEQMESFGRRLAEHGVAYLDATIAGSSAQVRSREATVIAGGDPVIFAACSDIFECFAKARFHVGECGSGARLKLVVNLVLGLNRAVLAEALAFAEACSIAPEIALDVLKASPAYSRVMDVKGTRMLSRDYQPDARLTQHRKDVQLILGQGERHRARLPLSRLHYELLRQAEEAGYGESDNSAIVEVMRRAGD
jgi:3-hydroxyisobutyrate dehydrogenase-like beta-hydroxyacid dehydrogenase